MQVYKKILVTMDCSSVDDVIIEHVTALALQNEAEVNLIHVVHSHYFTVNVAGAMWVALVLVLAERIWRSGSVWWYLLAGLAIGLATATKYLGLLLILPVLTVHLLGRGRGRSLKVLLLLVAIASPSSPAVPIRFCRRGNSGMISTR